MIAQAGTDAENVPREQRSYADLEARCKVLEEALTTLREDLESARSEVNASPKEPSTQSIEHAAELQRLKEEHRVELNRLHEESDTRYEALKAQHLAELSQIKSDFEDKARERQSEYDRLKAERDVKFRDCLQVWKELLFEEIEALKKEVEQLKEERKIMKPLFDVGAAVRLRYLEKAKKTLYSPSFGAPSEESQPAAHRERQHCCSWREWSS